MFQVTYNDDCYSGYVLTSCVVQTLTAGVIYSFQVDGYSSALFGPSLFAVYATPANDNWARCVSACFWIFAHFLAFSQMRWRWVIGGRLASLWGLMGRSSTPRVMSSHRRAPVAP